MIELVICIFAIYGISVFIKDMDGPLNIMTKLRVFLMSKQLIGVFVYKLLSCYFCVGAYSGLLVYILRNHLHNLNGYDMILWVFGGCAVSMIGYQISNKLAEGEK